MVVGPFVAVSVVVVGFVFAAGPSVVGATVGVVVNADVGPFVVASVVVLYGGVDVELASLLGSPVKLFGRFVVGTAELHLITSASKLQV